MSGCYNITVNSSYPPGITMVSPARPSECFSLCNSSDSVALQGNKCYCTPYRSYTYQPNYLYDEKWCTNECHDKPAVFCGGNQPAMSVYSKDISISSLLGNHSSHNGCVYVQMTGDTFINEEVDELCDQAHGVLCFLRSTSKCCKSKIPLKWTDALRYCSNVSRDITAIIAPFDRALHCTYDSSSNCLASLDGLFWIGLYKDNVKETTSSTVTTPVESTQMGKSNASSLSTQFSDSTIHSSETNVGVAIGGCVSGIAVVAGAVAIYLYCKNRNQIPRGSMGSVRRRIYPAADNLDSSISLYQRDISTCS